MTPYRLRNDDAQSWALYPTFEKRCLDFIVKNNVDFDLEDFRSTLRSRFNDPVLDRHRLYLFLQSDGSIAGHFLAWIDVAHKRPYAHIHQLEADDGLTITDVMEKMFTEVDRWIEAVNEMIPGGPRIDKVEWWTWHDPKVFARYLRSGADVKISRYVLGYSVSERKARGALASVRERMN
jgi:hypothetical protein